MEKLDAPIPVEVVGQVLTATCPSSTFLVNAGLQSRASYTKAASHVQELKVKLAQAERINECMLDEVFALRKRTEESEAVHATRDEKYEIMFKKTEEQREHFAAMMDLMGAKPS